MQSTLKHLGDFAFEATSRGHAVRMDTNGLGSRDSGQTPKELLLAAISGCTAMDVIGLLRKYKVAYERFDILADAEQTDTHPKVFKKVELTYDLTGTEIPLDRVREAVEHSMTRYCGVSAMVSKVVPLHYTIRINGEALHQGQAHFF